MTSPTVTVQTVVYNAEQWIKDTMDSILNQTFEDFEYIIVNDGSTDKTTQILNRYNDLDERIRVINQSHLGTAHAHNQGIKLARGKYIAILDADDLALSRRLEYQVQFLDVHPNYGMVGGTEIAVELGSGRIWIIHHPPTYDKLRDSWVWRQKFAHSAVMMRKRILEQTGLYDPKLPIGHDPDLWTRIAAKFPVANLQEPVVIRRHYSGSLSSSDSFERVLAQLKINAKAVRCLGLPFKHYFSLTLPLLRFCLPVTIVRRIRCCLHHEEILTVEELVRMFQLEERDTSILRIALNSTSLEYKTL